MPKEQPTMTKQKPTTSQNQTTQKPLPTIILASASPRRRDLMAGIGVPHTAIDSGVNEKGFDIDHLSADKKVLYLSRAKATAVKQQHPDALVIGSDTVVVLNGMIYEKPVDKGDAFMMLKTLQGTNHEVLSAITLICPDGSVDSDYLSTKVYFRPMSDEQIDRYIDSGEPMDKAGSYAIQGLGSMNIERIEGCYFNVVGMSMVLLAKLFERNGYALT